MLTLIENGIPETAFKARFPLPYCTQALTPWEAQERGLDWTVQQWVFTAPFIYVSDKFGEIYIPCGFTTDGASVPLKLQSIIGRTDRRILFPSAAHDWLYCQCGLTGQPLDERTATLLDGQGLLEPNQLTRRLTFDQVNEVLTEAMYYCGADAVLRAEVKFAVQNGGKTIWNRHTPPAAYRA